MIVEGCTGPLAVSTGLWTVCRLSFCHLPPHQSRYVNCDNNKTVDPRHIKGVGTSILSWSNLRHFRRLYKSVERPIIESTPIRNPIGNFTVPMSIYFTSSSFSFLCESTEAAVKFLGSKTEQSTKWVDTVSTGLGQISLYYTIIAYIRLHWAFKILNITVFIFYSEHYNFVKI